MDVMLKPRLPQLQRYITDFSLVAPRAPGAMWLAILLLALVLTVLAGTSFAQGAAAPKDPVLVVLWRWMPLLLWGFCFNLVISAGAMSLGTGVGVLLGLAVMSRMRPLRIFAQLFIEVFRNSPWLVLLFACVFLLPFQIHVFGLVIPFPDWAKAILGFALPIMANTAELVRGAVLSIPTGQWESAESLGYTRSQAYMQIILPQCYKRMLPPWMNLYSLVTMSTVNASIVGVGEMITLTSQALAAEGSRPELLAPFYAFALICFFVYCYPIGKWTEYLERKYQVKI